MMALPSFSGSVMAAPTRIGACSGDRRLHMCRLTKLEHDSGAPTFRIVESMERRAYSIRIL